MLVSVTVEILEQENFKAADIVTIPVGGCELSLSASNYSGVHGRVSIKLAYAIITSSEEFIKDCIEEGIC